MTPKRDYSFEALVEVTGADLEALTKNERGRINAALKELRELIPDDYILAAAIHERAKAWHTAYPEIALTPQALTGAWSSIEQKAADTRRIEAKPVNAPPAPRLATCETCEGNRFVIFSTRPSLNPLSPHEEMAPCPVCNSMADTDFWRADGSRFRAPDPDAVRARLA